MLGITTTNARVGGFRGGISAEAKTIYNRIIADGGVSNLTRLNFFIKGLKAIYGDLANVPVCYDAHWIGYKLGSGTGATSGQAAAKLYSLTVAGDAVQSTAASQPLLLAHNGDNYWWGSGVTGNYCSTPNAAANQITGDFELIANIRIDLLTGSGFYCIIDKSLSVNYQYILEYNKADGKLSYSYNVGGSNLTKTSTVSLASVGVTVSTNFWIKLTRTSSNGDIKYYTSLQSEGTAISSLVFTQLGVTISGTSGVSTVYNARVNIGEYNANGSTVGIENLLGRIYRLTLSNSIGGAPVVDFNPATYNASTSQTQWTSSTGEVWTINTGTATSGYKGQLVSKTIVMADGVDDRLTSSAITSISNRTNYLAVITWVSTNANYFMDGSVVASNGVLTGNPNRIGIITNAATTTYADFVNRLKLSTTKLSGTTQGAAINNGTETTATVVSPLAFTSVNLGSAFGGIAFINAVFSTIAISNSADDSTNRTAMYNLIRSLNENAF